MTKLWKKKNGHRLHPLVEKFTAGTDYIFDVRLIPFDVAASIAHAQALKNANLLSGRELRDLTRELRAFAVRAQDGKITITPQDEDCHTVLENYLIKKLGDAGKKIHTGRSRNDQVLAALRLYMKNEMKIVRALCIALAEDFARLAKKYRGIPMPGYSHTQQAMLSSVGHYYASIAESLLDDESLLASLTTYIDKNPLGSAAGFGTAIPIDRASTTKKLGFAKTQINSLYAQASRGKFESAVMEGLSQVALTLARFSNDMILFTSKEFGFFKADGAIVTGSSIMPQKRNLDALELVRGTSAILLGNHLAIRELSRGLLSGYNRDLQLIKKPLIESFISIQECLSIVALALTHLTPDESTIRSKIHPGMFAADIANDLVLSKGIPFRDAYRLATDMGSSTMDMARNIASKKTIGAPGNLSLETYKKCIQKQRAALACEKL